MEDQVVKWLHERYGSMFHSRVLLGFPVFLAIFGWTVAKQVPFQ